MKILNQILIIGIFLNVYFIKAQQKPTSQIKVAARYTDHGVELRFFPDRKKTLDLGLKSGFILERAEGNSKNFTEIVRTKPFPEEEWSTALQKAKTEDEKIQIEISQDFYISSKEKNGGKLDFATGIADLKQQKADEDFQFMVSILTAIKNAEAAKGLGLAYTDSNTQSGKKYTYRVKLVENSSIYKIESVPVTIETIKNKSVYKNKVYIKTGDTKLGFIWVDNPNLSGVDVEREINGVYKKLNNAPIYTIRGKNFKGDKRNGFNEDSLVNYQKYTYRFYAQTIFGEHVKFAEVTGMPRDLTPPQKPFLKQPKHIKPNEVLIEWEMNKPIESDFKGFKIGRSKKSSGSFTLLNNKLLPSSARKFIDTSFVKGKENYYLVQAIDTANNVSSSFPVSVTLIDSIPPKKPKFISGKIDSLGVVTVTIQKNKENDLMGYRLYRSNSPEHEFSVIKEGFLSLDSLKNKAQTVFLDTVTLKSLTPYIYYRTEALDFNHNTSKFSEILKVKRPDTIPPTTPVFKKVKVGEDFVQLGFALSKSRDVKQQTLYRKLNLKDEWKQLTILQNEQKEYIDKNLKKGTTYYYTIQAVDDSKNKSDFAKPVAGKPYDNGVRPTVENITMQKNKTEIKLSWKYPLKNENTYFVIYKKNKNGNLKQYNNTVNLYFTEPISKEKATYAVKVFTKDGGQSKISREVTTN
ncbi:MAG: fibronectin type III domain-containing protein [Lutibacter sp.]